MDVNDEVALLNPSGLATLDEIVDEPAVANRPARPCASVAERVLISRFARAIDFSAIIVPFLVFIAAVIVCWGHGLGWVQLGIMFAMYQLTGFGVTVGLHRLFAHRAFAAPRFMTLTLAILGSMSVQGPFLWWVAIHRRHHHYSDEEGDPHSPNLQGSGLIDRIRGAWHSHVGWLFKPDAPGADRYVRDLLKDPALTAISDFYPLWVILSLLIPAALGGILTRSWTGMLMGFVWGGVLRVFMVHHITWSVNSVCHIWGTRPFKTHDQSRNNVLVGIFALGEGWHNNHHAFPTSARHGMGWWQPDVTYMMIQGMAMLGLAHAVKVPAPKTMATKLENATEP